MVIEYYYGKDWQKTGTQIKKANVIGADIEEMKIELNC